MTSLSFRSLALLALFLPVLSACDNGKEPDDKKKDGKQQSEQPKAAISASMFVKTAPDGAVGVREAIKSAKPGQDIVVRAVVGGRKKAFVDGRAILVAIDTALKPCPDEEGCPTPWDYCCETKETLLANTMTVQIVDDKGAPIAASLSGVHGLKELVTIVVAGSVRNAEGSLVVDAKKIHVVGG